MHWLGVHIVWKELYTQPTGANMLVYVSMHANPPKVVSDHVDGVADSLVSFGIMELYNDKGC